MEECSYYTKRKVTLLFSYISKEKCSYAFPTYPYWPHGLAPYTKYGVGGQRKDLESVLYLKIDYNFKVSGFLDKK